MRLRARVHGEYLVRCVVVTLVAVTQPHGRGGAALVRVAAASLFESGAACSLLSGGGG